MTKPSLALVVASVAMLAAPAAYATGTPDKGPYYQHSGWKVWQGGQAIGCQTKDAYGKLSSLQSSGDTVAFKRELASQMFRGECRIFKPGEEVYLEVVDYNVWKLRPRGNPDGYWIKASKEDLPSK